MWWRTQQPETALQILMENSNFSSAKQMTKPSMPRNEGTRSGFSWQRQNQPSTRATISKTPNSSEHNYSFLIITASEACCLICQKPDFLARLCQPPVTQSHDSHYIKVNEIVSSEEMLRVLTNYIQMNKIIIAVGRTAVEEKQKPN